MSIEFWRRWLIVVTGGVMIYGFCLILLPQPTLSVFTWMVLGSPNAADSFGAAANEYIRFAHGVLGAVIIGWMVTVMRILITDLREHQRNTLALSITLWFVIDTGFSLIAGSIAHAVFNLGFLILFAIPLIAIILPPKN